MRNTLVTLAVAGFALVAAKGAARATPNDTESEELMEDA
jgi:hypothetical protein